MQRISAASPVGSAAAVVFGGKRPRECQQLSGEVRLSHVKLRFVCGVTGIAARVGDVHHKESPRAGETCGCRRADSVAEGGKAHPFSGVRIAPLNPRGGRKAFKVRLLE